LHLLYFLTNNTIIKPYMKRIVLLTIFAFMIVPFTGSIVSNVKAASLTTVKVTLTPETASTATQMVITFTPATAITTGSILQVTYDDDFTGGAALTNADVTIAGTNITSTVESGFAAGYFQSVLTNSAPVTGTVTITIGDGAGALNDLTTPAAGNYNVSIAIDIGGAGSTFDYGAGLAYVAHDNDVTVTATVPPMIDMEIYQQNSATMTNVCPLGILSVSKVNTCIYDVGAATNNVSGLTIKVTSDGALNDASSNTINAVADGTVTAGSEEYGFQITDDGSANQYAGGGTFETSHTAVPTTETTFATTSAIIDGITTQADRLEVTHYASMSTATVVGAYNQVVTYTAYTN
jgi:hypothetical protein